MGFQKSYQHQNKPNPTKHNMQSTIQRKIKKNGKMYPKKAGRQRTIAPDENQACQKMSYKFITPNLWTWWIEKQVLESKFTHPNFFLLGGAVRRILVAVMKSRLWTCWYASSLVIPPLSTSSSAFLLLLLLCFFVQKCLIPNNLMFILRRSQNHPFPERVWFLMINLAMFPAF